MSEEGSLNAPSHGEPNSAESLVQTVQERQSLLNRAARIARGLGKIWRAPRSRLETPISGEGPIYSFEENEEVVEDPPETEEPDSDWYPAAELLLKRGKVDLMNDHLQQEIGLDEETSSKVANLMIPVNLYLKKMHDLGLPLEEGKVKEAHRVLIEEKGRPRIVHLRELVGGREEELRRLMRTEHNELLAEELKVIGVKDSDISRIADAARLSHKELAIENLRRDGASEAQIEKALLTLRLSEIPPYIARAAESVDIPLETLVKARESFKRADWKDTLDYLSLAREDEKVRELLAKDHDIHIEQLPETQEEKRRRLENMTLKEINQEHPKEWEEERDRRVQIKRRQLDQMLEKFKDYLPLEELPLPDDVDIPPEVSVPDDFLGAYGLWRRLVTESYAQRLSSKSTYRSVRAEIQPIGGNIPHTNKKIPIISKWRHRWYALKVLRAQKSHARRIGDRRNFGVLGFGYTQYKRNFRSIEEADEEAMNIIQALSFSHRADYISDGEATARMKLAEQVVSFRLREIAIKKGRLDPIPPHSVNMPTDERQEHADEGMV